MSTSLGSLIELSGPGLGHHGSAFDPKSPAFKFFILYPDSVNLKLSLFANLAGTSPSLGPAVLKAPWSLIL